MSIDSEFASRPFKSLPSGEEEKGSKHVNEPDLSPQDVFLDLLGDLWDAILNIAYCDGGDLKICHAVMAMISFLVAISRSKLDAALSIEYPDDLLLVGKIGETLSSQCPNLARELRISINQLSFGSSKSLGTAPKSEVRPRFNKAPARIRKQYYVGSIVPLVHCVSYDSHSPNRITNGIVPVSVWSWALLTNFIRGLYYG